ncbi:hypothetical protein AM228_21515 [Planktothricoides sp. SR001]|nr:hypothetical protein AM228_21515 [Planktothricoides sp. SR001]
MRGHTPHLRKIFPENLFFSQGAIKKVMSRWATTLLESIYSVVKVLSTINMVGKCPPENLSRFDRNLNAKRVELWVSSVYLD